MRWPRAQSVEDRSSRCRADDSSRIPADGWGAGPGFSAARSRPDPCRPRMGRPAPPCPGAARAPAAARLRALRRGLAVACRVALAATSGGGDGDLRRQAEVTQDRVDQRPLVDRRDEPQPPATPGARQRVKTEAARHQLGPRRAAPALRSIQRRRGSCTGRISRNWKSMKQSPSPPPCSCSARGSLACARGGGGAGNSNPSPAAFWRTTNAVALATYRRLGISERSDGNWCRSDRCATEALAYATWRHSPGSVTWSRFPPARPAGSLPGLPRFCSTPRAHRGRRHKRSAVRRQFRAG